MKVSREVKTAVLVIGAILLFIWGYYFLRGRDLFNSYKTYYVTYTDVEGLSPSAPITLNGLVVGKVTSIKFKDFKSGQLEIEMQVKTDFPISVGSHATLYEPSLLGGKQIALIPNMQSDIPAKDGSHLLSGLKPGMLSVVGEKLSPLQTKVEATVVSADSLLKSVSNVLDLKTQENLRIAIAEMSATMKQFNQAATSLNGVIAGNKAKIDGTMNNLNRTSANFAQLSDSLNKANLGQAVKNLEKTLASVDKMMGDVEAGKGTLGKLMKDEAMYNNLTGASKELKELLADLKNNPKRYMHFSVFGKKGTPYKEPVETTTTEEIKK